MNQKKQNKIKEEYLTYDDYSQLPDEWIRYELVDGVLHAMSPSPHPIHQLVSQELVYNLKDSCQSEFVVLSAPIDMIISENEIRQPDMVMMHLNKLEIVTKRGIEGIPDLVVEILSPSSIRRDRMEKLISYAQYGIQEYWLIDPVQKYLEQYVLEGECYHLQEVYTEKQKINSPNIPCASFSMDTIFSRIPNLPNMGI